MATAVPTPAQAELISSLTQDDIPIKLRCAICSKLAINAFRLPCCEQAICDTCHSSLSSSCPVCEHTPIAAEDCKPHKSLRTTIKVFLRTEEKKREASRAKELKDTPPITPIEAPTPVVEIPAETPASTVEEPVETPAEEPVEETTAAIEEKAEPLNGDEQNDPASLEEQQDIPQQSVEQEVPPGQESNEDSNDFDAAEGTNEDGAKTEDEKTQANMSDFSNGFGFDAMAAGGFPNMVMNGTGDFNQIQMMMAMQNGMTPNSFGSFPMMGMPGMNMDPMAMQNMFINGGFGGGMGMMGMGTDFNGMMGNNFNGGNWNSTQQSWNHGNQNNFNQANAVAGAHGDFGAQHHQNFPARGNFRGQYNDYSQNNVYGWRGGRGRGRGGFYGGRGNFHGNATAFGDQAMMPNHFGSGGANPAATDPTIPTGPKADSLLPAPNVDEFGREARTTSEKPLDPHDSGEAAAHEEAGGAESTDVPNEQAAANVQDGGVRPIQTLDEAEAAPYNNGYGQDFSHGNQYTYQGRGLQTWHNGYNSMPPPVVPDVPVNAPTGPKAMREGNVNLRGRGFSIVGRGGARTHGSLAQQEVHSERSTSRTAEPEKEEKSRSPSRSSRKEEDKVSEAESRHDRRRHRHREDSPSEDSEERERRRERRRRRERARKYEGEEGVYDEDKEESKTREASPAESRRSSHRSRRDRDKDRERDRDYKSSRSHRSSHRSHRDRSRDRSREHRSRRHHEEDDSASLAEADIRGDEDKGSLSKSKGDRDRDTKSSRDREDREKDRERSSRHGRSHRDEERSSRHGTSHRERGDRESDRSRRKDEQRERERETESSSKVAPAVDPHTLEREARNRERLLKEAQRIAGLASIAGVSSSKRGRDEHEGGNARRSKHRRRSGALNYDGAGDEPDEERIARGESKRESSRWE